MKQTCEYCTMQNIPFPEYDIQEEGNSNLKECYLMEKAQEPDAPIVLFFPLISDTFQKYKAPGKLPGSSVPTAPGPGTGAPVFRCTPASNSPNRKPGLAPV